MARKREVQVKFFLDENEKSQLDRQVERSKLNQSDFLRKCSLEKDIIVIDGLNEIRVDLKRIGNNLNQLTRLAHEGRVTCNLELDEIRKEFEESWQLLKLLTQKQV